MKKTSRILISLVLAGFSLSMLQAQTTSFEGRWDATVTIDETVIPFRLDVAGKGTDIAGTLSNGEEIQTTTSAQIDKGALR